MKHFTDKTILIIGASGGLGSTIARAFSAQGASLALAARRSGPAEASLIRGEGAAVSTHQADLTDPASLLALRDEVLAAHGKVDVVINAAGYDARKPLAEHSLDDFRRTIEVNLLGAMLVTQTFLPVMADGVILHLGGFADGRLAFPFYSADAASRAGVRAFAESVNRELALRPHPRPVVAFFSPSPADTEAERPFHPLWRQMGTAIVPVEKVAEEVVQAVARRRKVYIMGGWLTRFFAALNTVSPSLADRLLMNGYGEKMAHFFGSTGYGKSSVGGKSSPWRTLGILLVIISFVAYGFLLALPFLTLSAAGKLALAPALVVSGEAAFWIGGALLGKELVARYKRYLNPRSWCVSRCNSVETQ